MDATTQAVAHYAAGTRFEDVATDAVQECKRRLIDSIACAAAAVREPLCQRLASFAGHYSGTPAARLWFGEGATSLEMAAFVNGTLVRYQDYSDTFLGTSAGHPSDMIPALVAMAEGYGKNGAALLVAIMVAYEIYCSLADATSLQTSGLDQATAAAVGTAAGIANLLELSEEQAGNAISLALTPNLSLNNVRCGQLSDWKGCAGPNGARNGTFAALLAREGVTGPTAVVEGDGGLFAVTGPFLWRPGAGEKPLICQTHLKFHPVCYHSQSAVDAALALKKVMDGTAIADVRVETYEEAVKATGGDRSRWRPTTRETADHSTPFAVAVTLMDGGLTTRSYSDARMRDPATLALMDRITVTANAEMTLAYPASAQTRIAVATEDGRSHAHLQQYPKGNARNPLSDSELADKFEELYQPLSMGWTVGQALDALWSVDCMERVSRLVDLMRPKS